MFIDTHTRDSMVKSVCEALKISKFELREKLYTMDKTAKDDDEYYEMIDAFVDKRLLFPPDGRESILWELLILRTWTFHWWMKTMNESRKIYKAYYRKHK